jgi:hypothetical protein
MRRNTVRQEKLLEIPERGDYGLNREGRQAMQRAIDMGGRGRDLDGAECGAISSGNELRCTEP